MNKKNCIYIVKNDIRCKPKYCFQMIKGIFFIMIILIISTLIVQAVNSYYNYIIYGDSASNDIISYGFELDKNNMITPESKNVLSVVSDITEIKTVSILFDMLLPDENGNHLLTRTEFNDVIIKFDGKEYKEDKSIPEKTNIIDDENKLFVQLCPKNTDVLQESKEKYFNYLYPKESLIAAGSQPKNEKEIMISEYLLNKFGITEYEQLIGKNISVEVNGYSIFSDYKLTGVINSLDYYPNDTQIYIMESEENFKNYTLDSYGTFIACIEDPNTSTDVYKTLESKGILDSVFYNEGTAKIFTFAGKIRTAVTNIMLCVAAIILIGMIMSLYSIINSNINASRSYYGILQAMGMQKKSMLCVFILEQLFLIIVSAAISIIVSGILLIFINSGLNFIISDGLEVSFLTYLFSSLTVAGISGVLILSMSIIIFLIYQRKEITQNLKITKIY